MYKLVVLACAIAAVSAEADPVLAYAAGLPYGHAYTNIAPLAATYAHAAPVATYAHAAPVAAYAHAAPVAAYAHAAPVATYAAAAPVVAATYAHAAPVATNYALPPVRTIQEAPIVEQIVEPVEQWGYKVAY